MNIPGNTSPCKQCTESFTLEYSDPIYNHVEELRTLPVKVKNTVYSLFGLFDDGETCQPTSQSISTSETKETTGGILDFGKYLRVTIN